MLSFFSSKFIPLFGYKKLFKNKHNHEYKLRFTVQNSVHTETVSFNFRNNVKCLRQFDKYTVLIRLIASDIRFYLSVHTIEYRKKVSQRNVNTLLKALHWYHKIEIQQYNSSDSMWTKPVIFWHWGETISWMRSAHVLGVMYWRREKSINKCCLFCFCYEIFAWMCIHMITAKNIQL